MCVCVYIYIYIYIGTSNLPAKTIPAKFPRLNLSGRFPTDARTPALEIESLLESNLPESRNLKYGDPIAVTEVYCRLPIV